MRVTVIGAGIVGLCSSLSLARRGHDVTLLDPRQPTVSSTSTGNAGMIVPSHFAPLPSPAAVRLGLRSLFRPESAFGLVGMHRPQVIRWALRFLAASRRIQTPTNRELLLRLNLASRELYARYGQELGFEVVQKGLLALCETEHGLAEEREGAELARQIGLRAPELTPEEIARLDPGIKRQVIGAIHHVDDAHFSTDAVIQALTGELSKLGVKREDRSASPADLRGESVVLAAGWESSALAPFALPLLAGKGYSFTLKEPGELPEVCALLMEARVAVTPMGRDLRVAGTMELGATDESINRRRLKGIVTGFERVHPGLRGAIPPDSPVWVGMRPCSPDGLPYLGRSRRHANLIVAAGHAMMGMSLGPVTGEIVADLVDGHETGFNLTPLDPERYA